MKRPLKAALVSGLVCPGFGQIMNRERAKGTAVIVAVVGLLFWMMVRIFALTYHTMMPEGAAVDAGAFNLDPKALAHLHNQAWAQNWWLLLVVMAVWIYATVDAYLVAARQEKSNTELISK